jgi:hypothetical protein
VWRLDPRIEEDDDAMYEEDYYDEEDAMDEEDYYRYEDEVQKLNAIWYTLRVPKQPAEYARMYRYEHDSKILLNADHFLR